MGSSYHMLSWGSHDEEEPALHHTLATARKGVGDHSPSQSAAAAGRYRGRQPQVIAPPAPGHIAQQVLLVDVCVLD